MVFFREGVVGFFDVGGGGGFGDAEGGVGVFSCMGSGGWVEVLDWGGRWDVNAWFSFRMGGGVLVTYPLLRTESYPLESRFAM